MCSETMKRYRYINERSVDYAKRNFICEKSLIWHRLAFNRNTKVRNFVGMTGVGT